MKRLKQILSVLLVAVIMLAAVPITAVAYTIDKQGVIVDYDGELFKLRLYKGENNKYLLSIEGIPDEIMDKYYSGVEKYSNFNPMVIFEPCQVGTSYYEDSKYQYYFNGGIDKPKSKYSSYHNSESTDVSFYFENTNSCYNIVYIITDSQMISDMKYWNKAYFQFSGCDLTLGGKGSGNDSGETYIEAAITDIDLTLSEKVEAPKQDISDLTFGKVSNYTYNGKAKKPTVTIKDGSYKLEKGKDYTVSYKNNTNIGKATITVKGMGDYTGTKTLTFNIVPKKTTLKVKTSGSKATLTWAKVSGAEKYEIYYSVNGGKYKKLTTVAGSKTTVSLKNLDFDTNTYKFKIRATAKSNGKTYKASFSNIVKTS